MAENSERQGVHTVEISKTAATILIGFVLAGTGGFTHSYWNLASSNAVLVEQVSQLREFASAGDRCTAETCRTTRGIVERLRDEVRQHAREAEEWKRRILTCELKVSDCVACRLEFGIKPNGR